MLEEITNNALFGYALIFCRFGAALIFLPGLGEVYVTSRARLAMAILLTVIFYPLLSSTFPPMPKESVGLALYLAGEVVTGTFFGLLIRILQTVMHIAGMKIAFMSGLSTAMLFDTNQSTQGSVIGGFLSVAAITLVFTTDLHHVMLKALFETYQLIKVGEYRSLTMFSELSIDFISQTFFLAFKISAPTIIIGLVLYIAAGLMGRLMPTMQVFFVLVPVQVVSVFLFIAMSISVMLMVYISFVEDKILIFIN